MWTGENTLFMDHNDTSAKWASYILTAAPGSGTASDRTTVDFRFRLLDSSKSDSTGQLTVNINRPGAGITTQGGVENGTEYWEITDTGSALCRYIDALDTAELDNSGGWMATSRVRVLDSSTSAYAVYMLVADGQDRWSLTLSEDAAWYQNSVGGYTKLLDMDTTDAYHMYQLVHDVHAVWDRADGSGCFRPAKKEERLTRHNGKLETTLPEGFSCG